MKIDVTEKVMKRVAKFERRRSYGFFVKFLIGVFIVLGISILFLYLSFNDLVQQQSFALFSLFGEDIEIIKDYWRDTLSTFLTELPIDKIIIGIVFLTMGIIIVYLSRKKIKIMIKRLRSLGKY